MCRHKEFIKFIFFLFLLIWSVQGFAQNENFASDRPGLSDAPDLIGKNQWQIASGFDLSQYNHYQLWQLSTNTLKFRISKHLEARMDFGIQYDRDKHIYGTVGPSFGIKGLLLPAKGIIPKTAVIVEFYPPPFSSQQQAAGVALELCFANNWGSNSFYYNFGYDRIDFSSKGTSSILLGYQYQFNTKFAAFTEFYGFFPSQSSTNNYVTDVGITYQLNKKLQLDLTAGRDLSRPSGNSFSQGGITYNF